MCGRVEVPELVEGLKIQLEGQGIQAGTSGKIQVQNILELLAEGVDVVGLHDKCLRPKALRSLGLISRRGEHDYGDRFCLWISDDLCQALNSIH
jgi:hypothetical protein